MAASNNGGNVAESKPNTVIITENGVKIIGYTNLPSRLATTSSNLYGNNIAKFILSVGPTTMKELKKSKEEILNGLTSAFYPDYSDPAVRGMLVVDKGDLRWPNPRPYNPTTPTTTTTTPTTSTTSTSPSLTTSTSSHTTTTTNTTTTTSSLTTQTKTSTSKKIPIIITDEQQKSMFQSNANIGSLLAVLVLVIGVGSPDPTFSALIAVFALSSYAGQQVCLVATYIILYLSSNYV